MNRWAVLTIVSRLEFNAQVRYCYPSGLDSSGGHPAERQAYSVLAQERFATLGQPLPHWQEALARFMKRVTHLSPAPS